MGWLAKPETADAEAELRQRLIDVIGNATGPDRQCHLNVRLIASRARTDYETARRCLRRLCDDGIISRFPHPNGQIATMLATPPAVLLQRGDVGLVSPSSGRVAE